MVQVSVDRPLCEDDVGIFSEDQFAQRLRSVGVYHCSAVDLAGENGPRAEDPAGRLALGGAYGGGLFM